MQREDVDSVEEEDEEDDMGLGNDDDDDDPEDGLHRPHDVLSAFFFSWTSEALRRLLASIHTMLEGGSHDLVVEAADIVPAACLHDRFFRLPLPHSVVRVTLPDAVRELSRPDDQQFSVPHLAAWRRALLLVLLWWFEPLRELFFGESVVTRHVYLAVPPTHARLVPFIVDLGRLVHAFAGDARAGMHAEEFVLRAQSLWLTRRADMPPMGGMVVAVVEGETKEPYDAMVILHGR